VKVFRVVYINGHIRQVSLGIERTLAFAVWRCCIASPTFICMVRFVGNVGKGLLVHEHAQFACENRVDSEMELEATLPQHWLLDVLLKHVNDGFALFGVQLLFRCFALLHQRCNLGPILSVADPEPCSAVLQRILKDPGQFRLVARFCLMAFPPRTKVTSATKDVGL
jgi:hypothetical protein